MGPIFQGFCINRFSIGPLQYISSFPILALIRGDIRNRKTKNDSASRGVAHSPTRVSTEVLFSLPAEYRIFWKTHGIPRNFAEFRGIFIVDFSRNSAEFRGIPYVFAYGIPQITKWSRFQIPPRIKKKLLNKLFCISTVNAKKLVKEYSSEGLLHTNDSMTLMSIVLEEAHAFLLSSY